MNRMQKVVCCLLGLALAAFALPGVAGNDKKTYSLQMSVPAGQTTAPFNVAATITNEGNSTINSFSATLIYGGQTVVGVNQPASGNATFTKSTVSVKNMHPVKSGDSFTVTFQVNTCGDGHWGGTAWTGSQLNGQSFGMVLADSTLDTSTACGPPVAGGDPVVVPDSINPVCVTGERDFYDKDGTGGNPVEIFVTNALPNINGVLHFRWPDQLNLANNDASAAFKYTICGAVPVTQVAWLNTTGGSASTGTPVFVAAEDCIAPKVLPTPYGTLAADLGVGDVPGDAYVAVDTATPPPGPPLIPFPGNPPVNFNTPGTQFDIVIDNERIKVQLVCLDNDGDPNDAADCTEYDEHEGKALKVVQRGVGGTSAASHTHGVLLMSTPLPLLPTDPAPPAPYVGGHQALMCVASHNEDGSTTFFDIGGDGYHAP